MEAVSEYVPVVKQAHAFREISRDFTTPAEIFREAIANSLDAYAQTIWLRVSVQRQKGREVVVIDMADDGIGMSRATIEAFLNLSDSRKPNGPPDGMGERRMSGYKGHGTKNFFNSDDLEVLTYDGQSTPIRCTVGDPRGELSEGRVPRAEIEELQPETFKDTASRARVRR